jgi:hypothetical protein
MLRLINRLHPALLNKLVNPRNDPNFRPGELIKGTVIRQYPGKEVLITAKGRQFLAYTDLELTEGKKYNFQVKSSGSKIILALVNKNIHQTAAKIPINSPRQLSGKELIDIFRLLSKGLNTDVLSKDGKQIATSLQQLFSSILFNDKTAADESLIPRLINSSGLFWENKVIKYLMGDKTGSWKDFLSTDLKGLLLSLKKSLLSSYQKHEGIEKLIEKVESGISFIEQEQVQNLLNLKENAAWFFFIPVLIEDGFQNGEFVLKRNQEEEESCFLVQLEFSELGKIEFDVSIIKSVIRIRVLAEDSERTAYVNDHIETLTEALRSLGLTIGSISCEEKRENVPLDDQSASLHLVI